MKIMTFTKKKNLTNKANRYEIYKKGLYFLNCNCYIILYDIKTIILDTIFFIVFNLFVVLKNCRKN